MYDIHPPLVRAATSFREADWKGRFLAGIFSAFFVAMLAHKHHYQVNHGAVEVDTYFKDFLLFLLAKSRFLVEFIGIGKDRDHDRGRDRGKSSDSFDLTS